MQPWRVAFWRHYYISLRRSGRDVRARRFAVGVTLFLLVTPIYGWFLYRTLYREGGGGSQALVFYAVLLAFALLARYLMVRSHRKQGGLSAISITAPGAETSDRGGSVPDCVQEYLEARLTIISGLLARGRGESLAPGERRTPTDAMASRQVVNTRVRQKGLWEKLEPQEADLLGREGGTWGPEDLLLVLRWSEQLRLLRWVTRMDAEIRPLAHGVALDFGLATLPDHNHARPQGKRPLLNSWDVRVERDIALTYLARIAGELHTRGCLDLVLDNNEWVQPFLRQVSGDSLDLWFGVNTIADLSDNGLRLSGAAIAARERYASYLVDLLGAAQPFSFSEWERGRLPDGLPSIDDGA